MKETESKIQYAGFWLRVCSLLIDTIILFGIGFGVGLMLVELTSPNFVVAISKPIGVIVSWLYFAFMEYKYGATFGKQALELKVIDINGEFPTFLQATGRHFGRYLSLLILYVGFIMAGFTKKKQALHDILSDCLVVKKT
jgi:uncharacterized RDD family membrane protein YckC